MIGLRAWRTIHTWSSLICTIFLLILCVTGLPLIFHDELDAALNHEPAYTTIAADAPLASLDPMVARAIGRYPGQSVRFVVLDDDEPQVIVALATNRDGPPQGLHRMTFDSRTGALRQDDLRGPPPSGVTPFLLRLHAFLLLGLAGGLFLTVMGLTFVAALVSGAVLYGPFARRLRFGEVRAGRSRRLAWLDLHNLIGAVALVWMLVVGATGVMNTLSTPLFGLWEMTDVARMLHPYVRRPAVAPVASLDRAIATARAAVPDQAVASITFPAHFDGSPVHYVVWLKGARTLTSRLMTPVLVDARSGRLDQVVHMPWYLRALEVSRPLHFGDYGGLTLKILWAALDVMTILALASGLYLWFSKRAGDRAMPESVPAARRRESPPNVRPARRRRGSAVWMAPASVGLVSALGLLTALLASGAIAQAAGCLAVAAPLLTLLALGLRRSGPRSFLKR